MPTSSFATYRKTISIAEAERVSVKGKLWPCWRFFHTFKPSSHAGVCCAGLCCFMQLLPIAPQKAHKQQQPKGVCNKVSQSVEQQHKAKEGEAQSGNKVLALTAQTST